jgi:hypothetical protein
LVIQFSGMPKGRYSVSLNGIDGKLLYNKEVVLTSGKQIETIAVAGHISAGLFVVRLSNGVNVNKAFKIVAK